MKHYCVGLGVVLLLLGLVVPVYGQGTFKLTYEPASQRRWDWFGENWWGKCESTPENLKKPHKSLSDKAGYFVGDLDGKQVIVAYEPDPLTFVVDTDLDSDLSDETPIKHPNIEEWENTFIEVTIKGEDAGALPVPVAFRYLKPEEGGSPTLNVRPGGAYVGKATFGGETVTIAVCDTTYNGRTNDILVLDQPSDSLGVDYSGDGHFDPWDEMRPITTLTNHGKSLYNVSVAADGSSITFTPATVPCGKVEVTSQGAILTLTSGANAYRLNPRGEALPLPVGKYNIDSCQILSWDDQDRLYRMQCLDRPQTLCSLEIREGETTVLGVGPPMKAKAVPVREGDKITINVEVWGAYGERYFPYVRSDGGGFVGWQGMKIIDEEGNDLDSGAFEYG